MFTLFKIKTHFVDVWSGTPDIHSHVLPGIDDGAVDIEQSEAMLAEYQKLGCPLVVATPHIMEGIYDNNNTTITESKKLIQGKHNGLVLKIGAEYMLDSQFENLLQEERLLDLGKRNLLIEMSYFQPPGHLSTIFFNIQSKGYKPILAHPERYLYYHKNLGKLTELKKLGCDFQLNALSLCGHYGVKVKELALKLLNEGAYDFIGTDAHCIDHLIKLQTIQIPKKQVASLKKVCLRTKELFLS